jgi:hypothetical protein
MTDFQAGAGDALDSFLEADQRRRQTGIRIAFFLVALGAVFLLVILPWWRLPCETKAAVPSKEDSVFRSSSKVQEGLAQIFARQF